MDKTVPLFAERMQDREERELASNAARSYPALRKVPEPDSALRTPFQRDRDRIVHSKAFRRLKYKTQVFIAPTGDHYRTRLTHTLEVTQVSRTVARALSLNEDLAEAIGMGHDLGHSPFGHLGEKVLDECMKEYFDRHFFHYEHSLRVVECLERDGQGLNLTEQVRDGILHHSSGAGEPATLEGAIVRLVDRVAYINHDIDDALRAGLLTKSDLPEDVIALLGDTSSERIDVLVQDLVEHSQGAGVITQGEIIGSAMTSLRDFMFERVYLGERVQSEYAKIELVLRTLFNFYRTNPEQLPPSPVTDDLAQRVVDYLAGMTDRYCISCFEKLAIPKAFSK